MAFCTLLASTLCVMFLFSAASGQKTRKGPPACPLNDYSFLSDGDILDIFHRCDQGGNRYTFGCGKGLAFDLRLQTCNYPWAFLLDNFPCTPSNIRYPSSCNNGYFECTLTGYVYRECPTNQYFQLESGQCTTTVVNDHEKCYRPGTTGGQNPTINCTMVAGPTQCTYRNRLDNNQLSDTYNCADGTEFSAGNCTCIHSTVCTPMRPLVQNKVIDPLCRPSFAANFKNIVNGTKPQVTSDKIVLGTTTVIDEYIESQGVNYANGVATFSANTITGAPAVMNIPYFAGNMLTLGIVITLNIKISVAGTFILLSNTFQDTCIPTFQITATFQNGQLQLNAFNTGVPDDTIGTLRGANAQNTTLTLAVSTNDNIEVNYFFDGVSQLQAINKGSNPDATGGQVVTSTATAYLGRRMAYNNCGFQVCKNFNGVLNKFIVREACGNLNVVRAATS